VRLLLCITNLNPRHPQKIKGVGTSFSLDLHQTGFNTMKYHAKALPIPSRRLARMIFRARIDQSGNITPHNNQADDIELQREKRQIESDAEVMNLAVEKRGLQGKQ